MTRAHALSPEATRIVTAHSALAGLCPLIPVPFVDDMLARRIAERMHRSLFAAHDLELTHDGAEILTSGPSGWLRGAATAVALFPIKKLVRKLVFVLAVKDCADVAAAVFHDGWLTAGLLARPPADLSLTDRDALKRVRAAMLRTYRDINPAPLRHALAGALLAARTGVVRAARRVRHADAAPPDETLIEAMRAAAMTRWPYLERVERRFREHLERPAAADGDSRRAG
jgi:uncharacterized protein (DUF697 family)